MSYPRRCLNKQSLGFCVSILRVLEQYRAFDAFYHKKIRKQNQVRFSVRAKCMSPHFMKNLLSLNLHNSVFHYETIKGCKLCVNCSLQFLAHWQNSALNSFVLFVYISYCIGTRWSYISVFLVIVHKYKRHSW